VSQAGCCAPPALASLAYAKPEAPPCVPDSSTSPPAPARHGRGHLTLHLPEGWREHEWMSLLEAACGPPAAAA